LWIFSPPWGEPEGAIPLPLGELEGAPNIGFHK
jgi:hypothetical protein